MLIDSESNLTALHTAVKVKAVFLSTEIPLPDVLPMAFIIDKKSLFSFFLNKFVKKSVIAKVYKLGILQLYAIKKVLLCILYTFTKYLF